MSKHEPPKTIQEVGIHLQYMSTSLEEVKNTLTALTTNFAEKEDLSALEVRVTALESKNTIKNTLLWVGLVASAIINIVVIYQLFTGK